MTEYITGLPQSVWDWIAGKQAPQAREPDKIDIPKMKVREILDHQDKTKKKAAAGTLFWTGDPVPADDFKMHLQGKLEEVTKSTNLGELTTFHPVLVTQNCFPPYEPDSEDAYKNAVTGDYDLFAMWPVRPEPAWPDLMRLADMQVPFDDRKNDGTEVSALQAAPGKPFGLESRASPDVYVEVIPGYKEIGKWEDPERGNIHNLGRFVVGTLNSFIFSHMETKWAEGNSDKFKGRFDASKRDVVPDKPGRPDDHADPTPEAVDDLRNEGFPADVAGAFIATADATKSVVMSRAPGGQVASLVEHGHDLKSYQAKAKSCNWGPMSGFLCQLTCLNKAGAKKVVYNDKQYKGFFEHIVRKSKDKIFAEKLDAGWTPFIPLRLFEKRKVEALEKKSIDFQHPIPAKDYIVGVASHKEDGKATVAMEFLLKKDAKGLWNVYHGRVVYLDYKDGTLDESWSNFFDRELFVPVNPERTKETAAAEGEDKPKKPSFSYPNQAFHSDEGGRPGIDEVDLPAAVFLPADVAKKLRDELRKRTPKAEAGTTNTIEKTAKDDWKTLRFLGKSQQALLIKEGEYEKLIRLARLLRKQCFVLLNHAWLMRIFAVLNEQGAGETDTDFFKAVKDERKKRDAARNVALKEELKELFVGGLVPKQKVGDVWKWTGEHAASADKALTDLTAAFVDVAKMDEDKGDRAADMRKKLRDVRIKKPPGVKAPAAEGGQGA